jgi:hypothetical protein
MINMGSNKVTPPNDVSIFVSTASTLLTRPAVSQVRISNLQIDALMTVV